MNVLNVIACWLLVVTPVFGKEKIDIVPPPDLTSEGVFYIILWAVVFIVSLLEALEKRGQENR